MILTHHVTFDVDLGLDRGPAVDFVRDAERSLARADFLESLRTDRDGGDAVVRAELPVNAAMFGQRRLRFASRMRDAPTGATLEPVALDERPGWAEVAGRAHVRSRPGAGSRVHYAFELTIHLQLPEPERWGGRALIKMVEVTADAVLRRVSARFPEAVRQAAREAEAAYA